MDVASILTMLSGGRSVTPTTPETGEASQNFASLLQLLRGVLPPRREEAVALAGTPPAPADLRASTLGAHRMVSKSTQTLDPAATLSPETRDEPELVETESVDESVLTDVVAADAVEAVVSVAPAPVAPRTDALAPDALAPVAPAADASAQDAPAPDPRAPEGSPAHSSERQAFAPAPASDRVSVAVDGSVATPVAERPAESPRTSPEQPSPAPDRTTHFDAEAPAPAKAPAPETRPAGTPAGARSAEVSVPNAALPEHVVATAPRQEPQNPPEPVLQPESPKTPVATEPAAEPRQTEYAAQRQDVNAESPQLQPNRPSNTGQPLPGPEGSSIRTAPNVHATSALIATEAHAAPNHPTSATLPDATDAPEITRVDKGAPNLEAPRSSAPAPAPAPAPMDVAKTAAKVEFQAEVAHAERPIEIEEVRPTPAATVDVAHATRRPKVRPTAPPTVRTDVAQAPEQAVAIASGPAPPDSEEPTVEEAQTASTADVSPSPAREALRADAPARLEQAVRTIFRNLIEVLSGGRAQAQESADVEAPEAPEVTSRASTDARPALAVPSESASPETQTSDSSLSHDTSTPDVPVDPPSLPDQLPADEAAHADGRSDRAARTADTSTNAARPEAARNPLFQNATRAAISWMESVLQRPAAYHTEANGTNVLRLRIDEESGSVTLKTRHDGDRVVVSVAFTDPTLQNAAQAQSDDIRSALQQLFESAVDLSFAHSEGGDAATSGEQTPERSTPHGSITRTAPAAQSSAPRSRVYAGLNGGRYEWVG